MINSILALFSFIKTVQNNLLNFSGINDGQCGKITFIIFGAFLNFFTYMFKSLFVLIMFIFSLFSAELAAIEVNDLYQASVIVDSQAREHREQAIKKALSGVFLKVGGKKTVLTHEVLIKATKRASRYVSQYRYQRKDDQLSIVVSFNEGQVNQLFEQANLALWGSLRPQVLLWLVDEQGASRNIVSSSAESIIPESINDFSIQRGLPIIMPLMDLADNEQVFVSDFWQYFPEQVQQASMRYFADTVVVMRLSDSTLLPETSELSDSDTTTNLHNSGDHNQAITSNVANNEPCDLLCEQEKVEIPRVLDWRVYTQGALYTQHYHGINKVSLINQGLSDITELIYQSYASLASSDHDFVIDVKNVTSLKEDSQLFDFLSDLSGVKAVTLTSAQGDVRRFKLDLTGSKASLLASLKLNKKLTQQIYPQLDDLSKSQQVDRLDGIDTDFDELTHHGLKVIVLGEDENSPNDKLNTDNVSQSVNRDTNTLTSDLEANSNPLSLEELSIEESLSVLPEVKPLLKIIPNIPVFYWEQE